MELAHQVRSRQHRFVVGLATRFQAGRQTEITGPVGVLKVSYALLLGRDRSWIGRVYHSGAGPNATDRWSSGPSGRRC